MIDQKSERGVGGRRINIFPCQGVGGEFVSESFEYILVGTSSRREKLRQTFPSNYYLPLTFCGLFSTHKWSLE